MLSDSEIARRLDQLLGSGSVSSAQRIDPLVGKSLGHYDLLERIGCGSYGVVYRAMSRQLKTMVAIKVLRNDMAMDRDATDRFGREASFLSQLDHCGIVGLLDNRLNEEIPHLVSELIDGQDLGRWHASVNHVPQPDEVVLRFMQPIVEAVGYAHSKGVIHRDIKPGNILLERCNTNDAFDNSLSSFRPILADFGFAKFTTGVLPDSRSSLTIGTPMYMAPEQLVPTWGAISAKSDIYSLGVMMAELANGRAPRHGMTFSELMSSILREERDPHILWSDQVSRNFRAIVIRCLQKDPIDRYANAEELRNDILSVLQSPTKRVKGGGLTQRFQQWARHPERPLEVCFFVIALNLIMFAWMLFNAYVIMGPVYHGRERVSDLMQCLGIAFGNNLLTAGLCVLRVYEKRWATVIALVITSTTTVLVPFLTAQGVIKTFNGLYESAPFFRVANHAQILLFGIVQSTLLAACVYADFSSKRRHAEPTQK